MPHYQAQVTQLSHCSPWYMVPLRKKFCQKNYYDPQQNHKMKSLSFLFPNQRIFNLTSGRSFTIRYEHYESLGECCLLNNHQTYAFILCLSFLSYLMSLFASYIIVQMVSFTNVVINPYLKPLCLLKLHVSSRSKVST